MRTVSFGVCVGRKKRDWKWHDKIPLVLTRKEWPKTKQNEAKTGGERHILFRETVHDGWAVAKERDAAAARNWGASRESILLAKCTIFGSALIGTLG